MVIKILHCRELGRGKRQWRKEQQRRVTLDTPNVKPKKCSQKKTKPVEKKKNKDPTVLSHWQIYCQPGPGGIWVGRTLWVTAWLICNLYKRGHIFLDLIVWESGFPHGSLFKPFNFLFYFFRFPHRITAVMLTTQIQRRQRPLLSSGSPVHQIKKQQLHWWATMSETEPHCGSISYEQMKTLQYVSHFSPIENKVYQIQSPTLLWLLFWKSVAIYVTQFHLIGLKPVFY